MLKSAFILVVVLWAGSVVVGYLFWGKSQEKIAKAEQDLKDYETEYRRVIDKGDSLETEVGKLQEKGKTYLARIATLEGVVDSLVEVNKNQQAQVAQLFQPDELVYKFRETFPEYKESPIGVARVPHPRTGFPIRTFQAPIQLVATFISDHIEVGNFAKQIAALREETVNYREYTALQDSIIALKEQKAEEYRRGLDYGMQMYQQLTKDYISTLKKPPKIGLPSATTIITSGALGAVAGALIAR